MCFCFCFGLETDQQNGALSIFLLLESSKWNVTASQKSATTLKTSHTNVVLSYSMSGGFLTPLSLFFYLGEGGLATCTKPTGAETQIHELGMPPVQSPGREFVGIKCQGILAGPDSLLVLRWGTQKELGLEWSLPQPKHPFVLLQSTLLCRHCSVLKKS